MRIGLLLLLVFCGRMLWAQDPPRFSPPKPPPLDSDFDDPDTDDADMPKAPPPSMPPPTSVQPPPAQFGNDTHPSVSQPEKFHFQTVEGEFYEKGKKRGRAPVNKRIQGPSS
jgi:hypothetical protein